jgi:transposase
VGVHKQTEIVLAKELEEQGLSKSAIARRLGRDRETIRLWLRGIERYGLKGYLDRSQKACKVPRPSRQVDALVKRYIWSIREREEQCCGQKIAYFLECEHGVKLSVPKIYEVLAEKYVLRSRKPRYQQRGAVPHAQAPRQVVQVDTVHFGQVFAFTAIDIFSREADVILRDNVTAADGVVFLRVIMARRFNGHVELLQSDGGPEFKGEFALRVLLFCDRHRIARPYKKNEQAHIESFNRTLRKECLGWGKYRPDQTGELQQRVDAFLQRYHYHRPHLAFEPMRPPLKK